MKTRLPNDSGDARVAFVTTIVMHALFAVAALVVILDDPAKDLRSTAVEIDVNTPASPDPAPTKPALQIRPDRIMANVLRPTTQPRTGKELHGGDKPSSAGIVAFDTAQTEFRKRITTDKLSDISNEEAFEELMNLLAEYPEYKGLVLEKMMSGKSMPESPDYFADLNIRYYIEHLDVKTKYEYESARQAAMFGSYYDPVNGPRSYQKTGLQINPIELIGWLKELIGGKKK